MGYTCKAQIPVHVMVFMEISDFTFHALALRRITAVHFTTQQESLDLVVKLMRITKINELGRSP
ncbi:predicted protein [Botrytis cinerea T4]|uniref:Uncharacterized protein n=1 Tax=Botryotinia fuckeliana (strain T4) TaxID=999810 RepID=G2YCA7_BOTF4|nr:predicted protein [Botrytis cinerea T4]